MDRSCQERSSAPTCSTIAPAALAVLDRIECSFRHSEQSKGHDVIRGHTLLEHKNATVTDRLYPIANFIEIEDSKVDGVTQERIAKAGWEEDQVLAKRLVSRKVGEAPTLGHEHK